MRRLAEDVQPGEEKTGYYRATCQRRRHFGSVVLPALPTCDRPAARVSISLACRITTSPPLASWELVGNRGGFETEAWRQVALHLTVVQLTCNENRGPKYFYWSALQPRK